MAIKDTVHILVILFSSLFLLSCGEVRYESQEQERQCQQLQQEEHDETHAFVKKSELNTAYTRLFGKHVLKNASKLVFTKDEDVVKKLTLRVHKDAAAECTESFKLAECRAASNEMQALFKRSTVRKERFKTLKCPGEMKGV